MSLNKCDLTGKCQLRTPACLGCDHHALAASVQASRDTGCCGPFGTDDDATNTLTRSERVGYWLGVGCAVGLSVVTAFGSAGYLAAKYLA